MDILDALTVVSYLAINFDLLLQIHKIRTTKSSHDVSLIGCSVRYIAIIIITAKFISLGDWSLLAGQALILATFSVYLWLVVLYAKHDKQRARARKKPSRSS